MNSYELGRVPRILAGPGVLQSLPAAVDELSAQGAVLVVDEAVSLTGYAGRVAAALRERPVVTHIVPPGEPTVLSVNAAAKVVAANGGMVVVGIGGGSALDTAKQAAVAARSDDGIEPYLLAAKPFTYRRPIIAIPTTSGTGAEVTRTCILSDADGRKLWTWGDAMLPDVVLLDPEATVTMPRHVTAATGLDAFVHALEACSGQRRNALSAAPAAHALALIVTHLPAAVADGGNLAARQAMQEAALLAGTAIDNCGTGIAHSIGHALGTLYHVPHGVAVSIGLDAAIDWNVAGAADAHTTAATALGASPSELPAVLRELFGSCRFAAAVHRLPDADLDAAAIAATMITAENRPMYDNNSRAVTDTDRHELAHRTVRSWHQLRAEGGGG